MKGRILRMFEHLSNAIAADAKVFATIFLLLIVVIFVAFVRIFFLKRKAKKMTPPTMGDIFEVEKDGQYIVVSPNAIIIDVETNEKFRVYQVFDRIWPNVGKKLHTFYSQPFEIKMKVAEFKKGSSNGYTVLVTDNKKKTYKLVTKYLHANYTIDIETSEEDVNNSK